MNAVDMVHHSMFHQYEWDKYREYVTRCPDCRRRIWFQTVSWWCQQHGLVVDPEHELVQRPVCPWCKSA